MSNFISDQWLRPANPIEAKYAEVLQDALNGKHSENADDCHLQNAVAQLVATELTLNPKLFSLDSDNAAFLRIGLQVARLVDRELNQCARFYAEAA